MVLDIRKGVLVKFAEVLVTRGVLLDMLFEGFGHPYRGFGQVNLGFGHPNGVLATVS